MLSSVITQQNGCTEPVYFEAKKLDKECEC